MSSVRIGELLCACVGISALATPLLAQSPPVVSAAPVNLTARPGTGPVRFYGTNVFNGTGMLKQVGTQISMQTTLGDIALEMFDTRTPLSAANFLAYINANPNRYANSFFHRSVPGFVLQGGGFNFVNNAQGSVVTFPPVQNEPGISNLRGTLAYAKLGTDPNSATSQFFVNLADNSANLDAQNGGFTVFARVVLGMNVVDSIVALPRVNAGSPFDTLPVRNYSGGTVGASNLIFDTITAPFGFTASSSNANAAAVSVAGSAYTLNFPTGANASGSADVTLTARDSVGSVNTTFNVNVSPTAPSARLANISTRAQVGVGDEVLIGGFVVRGSAPKRILVRSLGPSLTAFGVQGALSDPQIVLKDGQGNTVASNDNWKATQQADIQATGFAPTNDLDSALIATLQPGSYTAIVSGVGGATGVAIIEGYELNTTEAPLLINISSRGKVGTGDNVMIGGFVIGTSSPKKVIIRAVGPTLTNFGVTNAMANPTLQIFQGGLVIAENDNWKVAPGGGVNPDMAAIVSSGFPPTNDLECAVIATLAPGPYTAIVRGVNDTSGVALVEIYDLE